MVRPLSIIIPHYSKQQALRTIMEELKLQIEPEDEILIIDDYSPAGVPDFGCKCTRVIRPPEKLEPHIYRLNTLRNLGVTSAKNDAVIILDPDCLPNPNFLSNARKIFDPSILFAGRIDKLQKDGSPSIDPRTANKKSQFIDDWGGHGNGTLVWGGVMFFSKSRVNLVGNFDTDFDGKWGAEEHEFASRCFHSGMRLYYSVELAITHLYHEKNTHGAGDNMRLWKQKTSLYKKDLHLLTPYQPAVGVSVISMLRPNLLDQCLRAIFRNCIPLKVRLTVNGDDSKETKEALRPWKSKWAVDVIEQERTWPAKIRNDAFRWARDHQYKYLVFVDDDITVSTNGLINLVRTMEEDKDIFACSGFLANQANARVMLGGPLKDGMFSYLRYKKGVYDSDWVGGGFTIHRLKPELPYDDTYETGYNDYDWSMQARKAGMKLAVTGDAGAYHGVNFGEKGIFVYHNPPAYKTIRYDGARHDRMAAKFAGKWGFHPRMGPLID